MEYDALPTADVRRSSHRERSLNQVFRSGIRQTELLVVPYGLFMPLSLSPPSLPVVQLRNIRDVADDLSRELIRVQCPLTSAVHELTAFIKAEAETALTALKKPRR